MRMGDEGRRLIFQAAKKLGADYRDAADVAILDDAIDDAVATLFPTAQPEIIVVPAPVEAPAPKPPIVSHLSLTRRVAMEVICHEAIICEAYKDSKGIWTWGIGVTNKSGHSVLRYKDNPQSIERVLEVFLWLLRENYIPDVIKAFSGFVLSEAQFAAALSFHYNTGAILRADWVASVKAGRMGDAYEQIMDWKKPPEIIPRRKKERDLFFKGIWSSDGRATIYDVNKPSYTPRWRSARKVDVSADLDRLMGAK